MIDPTHETLSVARQCVLIGLSRSTLYYKPAAEKAEDLDLKALIDRQFLETPYFGSRKMTAVLRRQGHVVNRKRVRRLMREMGLQVIWRRPNTSKPNPEHRVYPYLLRGLEIDRPDIFNTDQGSQFTSLAFTTVLETAGVRISMDGKGRCMDNIFIERLWRSLKYEEVYLMAYATGSEARLGIGRWIDGYNARRPHQALAYRTPNEVYAMATGQTPTAVAA